MANFEAFDPTKRYLITGAAGFIGFHLAKTLASQGAAVAGFDNLNDYYDVRLKLARLDVLKKESTFSFIKGDLADKTSIDRAVAEFQPDVVVNLAAQAGVRYSTTDPRAYVDTNVVGFFNLLETLRERPVKHLIYASSSSVYGDRANVPFSTQDRVDEPISLYAATKRSNELFAYAYSHLYGIPVTGVRFFSVYGPYGRPDMATFLFTRAIFNDEPIRLFNRGEMARDFTYVDDVVQGVKNMLCNPPLTNDQGVRAKIYNIGNNKPIKLLTFVETLEKIIGKTARKELFPMQPGDVRQTCADVDDLAANFDFRPDTPIEEGIARFVQWYRDFYVR